jgi:putative ABC transport system permease protein
MFDLDRWQQIYSVLKKNKLRTFLTAFGVFWGIFMLIVMLGAGSGMKNAIMKGIGDFATNSFFMWGQETSVPYEGYSKGRSIQFKNKDVDILKRNIEGIDLIAPKLRFWGNSDNSDNVVYGLNSGDYTIHGDYPEMNEIDPSIMIYGRFINKKDIQEKRKVAVIGRRVYQDLFEKNENPIGKYLRVQGVYFQVIGVSKPLNPNISFGGNKEEIVSIPFTSFQQAFNVGDRIGMMAITAKQGVPVSQIEEQTVDLMKKIHTVSPKDERAIGHFNLEEQFNKIMGLFTGINVLIWIVGTGTLIAGIIGVSNIMLVVVKERTSEIGIQRAIGATPWNIINQILSESAVLTIFAGFFGIMFGVGLLGLANSVLANSGGENTMLHNPQISFTIALTALGILSFFGTLAGVLPARRAVKVKPIEAIRTNN